MGAASAAEAMQKVRDRLPEKRRKDAVLAIEYLITASPEAMQGMGGKSAAYSTMHSSGCGAPRQGQRGLCRGAPGREHAPHVRLRGALDESTGRLNARRWLGVPRP